jgi:hypothetical protein
MKDDLVTLGTYPDPVQANAAMSRLMNAGVKGILVDETPWGLGALTGQGVGWIKLQVREVDLDRAWAVLGGPDESAGGGQIPPGEADAGDSADRVEEADPEQTITEQNAAEPPEEAPPGRGDWWVTVGLRLAILGFLFFPLSVAAVVVLFGVAARNDPLSPAANHRYYVALLFALAWLGLLTVLFCAPLVGLL